MTNVQLYLLIAAPIFSALVPTIAVIISILRSDQKIDALRNDIRADMRILDSIGYDHHGRLSKWNPGIKNKEFESRVIGEPGVGERE